MFQLKYIEKAGIKLLPRPTTFQPKQGQNTAQPTRAMFGVILLPVGNRGIPSSPVGWLLPAASQAWKNAEGIPEGLFLLVKTSQRKSSSEFDGILCFFTALFDLLGDSGKGKQVVVVVLHLVVLDRLSAGSTDIKLPTVLQRVLQGLRFVRIFRDTGWERKMPGFDGVIAVVYADVHGFTHPFLTIVENLRFLLVRA